MPPRMFANYEVSSVLSYRFVIGSAASTRLRNASLYGEAKQNWHKVCSFEGEGKWQIRSLKK